MIFKVSDLAEKISNLSNDGVEYVDLHIQEVSLFDGSNQRCELVFDSMVTEETFTDGGSIEPVNLPPNYHRGRN